MGTRDPDPFREAVSPGERAWRGSCGGTRVCSVASVVFVTLWTVACQAPLSLEFSRQEFWSRLPFPPPDLPEPARLFCPWGFSRQEDWSGLPFPPPGDVPDPGIEPECYVYLLWQEGSLPLASPGEACHLPNRPGETPSFVFFFFTGFQVFGGLMCHWELLTS